MDHRDIKQIQQQQLQQILNETFTNTGYIDEDIGHLINDPSGNYHQIFGNNSTTTKPQRRESMQSNKSNLSNNSHHSNKSRKSSRKQQEEESQSYSYNYAYKQSFGSFDQLNLAVDVSNEQNDKNSIKTSQAQTQQYDPNNTNIDMIGNNKYLPQSFKKLNQYYRKYKTNYTISQIKQKYQYFVISQPSYTLTKTYQQNIFQYNTLKNINIQVMNIGYCTIADNFRIVIGTDDGRVAIFQKTYTKPVHIFQAFTVKKTKNNTHKQIQNNIKITAVQWSENLQYLAVAADNKQFKVYQFKQSIQIQDKNILRMLKQPIQIISLTVKQIKNVIINIKFISQSPFLAILSDIDDQMQILEYKINFMSYRPYLNKLPLKFNNVFQVQAIDFSIGGDQNNNKANKKDQLHKFFNNQNQYIIEGSTSINKNAKQSTSAKRIQQYGTLIAVGSDQYVTIALLKPYFQVIMVYDKQKHGKNIKKQGYAHISFRKQPLGLLIVWDKFAQLLNIQIQSLNPLQTKIRNSGTQLMPQTTLLSGLITDTLVYQLSQSGIKIYCTANFGQEKDTVKYKQSIYQHNINFYEFPQGIKIQQELVNNVPTLQVLRLFSSFICVSNGWLFITSNTSLFSVRIQKFQQFIRNTIQNINNWKIGLQLLHDGYLGKYKNYDNMTKNIIIKNIHQYSIKYINFLQMVIGHNASNNKIQENSSQRMLWAQQTTFLFNILIQTQQYEHLLNKILPKLQNNNLYQFISSLQPFIMLHKLPILTPKGLQLIFKHITNKHIISILLIANIDPQLNQIDLPHMINQLILQHGMFQEMVAVNMEFKDYFTPFAVMVSHYQAIINTQSGNKHKAKNDIQILTQLKLRASQSQRSSTSQKSQEQQTKQKQVQSVKQQQKQRLRSLIAYFTYKIFYKINNNEDVPIHATNTQRKKVLSKHKQLLQIFIPLFQSSIIPILLSNPQQQLGLFQCIIPELFKEQCLQLINDISNKLFNTDLMSDIAMGIPVSRVSSLKLYWMCLISLFNKSVIKMDVFMGLRYLANYGKQDSKNDSQIKDPLQIQKQQDRQIKQNSKIKKKVTQSQIKRQKRRAKQTSISQIQKFIKQTVNLSGNKIYEQFKALSRQLLQQFYNQLLSPNIALKSSHIGLLRIVALILGSGYYIKVIHAMMSDMETRRFDRRKSSMSMNLNKNMKKSIIKQNETQRTKPISNSDILFNFVQQTLTKFNKTQKQQFKRILYQNIQLFIEYDCDRLCDLIINYYLESINKFVSYNDIVANTINKNNYNGIVIGGNNLRGQSPQNARNTSPSKNKNGNNVNTITVHQFLLIRLIQGLLRRLESDDIQNRKIPMFQLHHQFMLDLRLKYLRLLALTGRQHQILSQVKKQNYPLDSSLEICRRYGVIDAQAYLLVKSGGQGEIASAIRLYFTLIMQKIKFLTAQNLPQFKDYFVSIVRQCIKVCQALHSTEQHFNEQWFLISQKLNDLKISIYRVLAAYTCDLLCDVIDKEVYPILAEKLVRNQNAQAQVSLIQSLSELYSMKYLKTMHSKRQTYIESETRQRKQITVQSTKGFVTTCTCYLCHESEGLIIHYNNCGHEIHPSCGQDVKVCIVCACREQKMMEKQLDLLRKIKPQVYGKQNQLIMIEEGSVEKYKKQTNLQKLKKYDQIKVDIIYL